MTYTALKDIHLHVDEGEFVGIMGPSGSGKTTLLNILATIDKPTSGKLWINGTDPAKLSNKKLAHFRRRELGFVFQDFNLLDTLSIKENIILPLALDQISARDIEQRLADTIRWLGIEPILDKRTYEVSGAEAADGHCACGDSSAISAIGGRTDRESRFEGGEGSDERPSRSE